MGGGRVLVACDVTNNGGWGWMEPLPRVFDMFQYFETI